jgi:hypothetical protein
MTIKPREFPDVLVVVVVLGLLAADGEENKHEARRTTFCS